VENAPQVFHLEETGGFYQAGLKKLMLQPEFNRTEKLRSIVELLEDKVGLTQLLCRARLEDGVRITIGHENPVKGTQTLSVISSAFGLGDNLGSVNVMGPTRMNYSRLCSIVDYTAKLIQKKLNQ
jgi:heat-inducible transcriptional repressor